MFADKIAIKPVFGEKVQAIFEKNECFHIKIPFAFVSRRESDLIGITEQDTVKRARCRIEHENAQVAALVLVVPEITYKQPSGAISGQVFPVAVSCGQLSDFFHKPRYRIYTVQFRRVLRIVEHPQGTVGQKSHAGYLLQLSGQLYLALYSEGRRLCVRLEDEQ